MADALGCAICRYCGARYTLWTISNRSMQGLCNAWKKRHESYCKHKTPKQRRAWARKWPVKDSLDSFESSIVVDPHNHGFLDEEIEQHKRNGRS